MNTTETDLERKYDCLAEAIDAVPEEKTALFLGKLALLLGERVDAAAFDRLVEAAKLDL